MQASIHSTDARIHGTDARIHGTDARIHGTDARIHGTDARLHGTDAGIRGTDAGTVGSVFATSAPSTAQAPSAYVDAKTVRRVAWCQYQRHEGDRSRVAKKGSGGVGRDAAWSGSV
eukprot:1009804-Rhodomonas_salina.14